MSTDTKKISLVPYEERELIVKKSWYVEMGTKIKVKVIDLEAVGKYLMAEREKKGMSPYIDIQPVLEDKYKNTSHTFSCEKDPFTGILYGIPVGLHEDGNVKWMRIPIIDEKASFNLKHDSDLKKWVVLRYWGKIQGSPFEIDGAPFKVYDSEMEAEKTMVTMDKMEEAIEKYRMMEGKQLAFFARTLGIPIPTGTSEKVLKAEVGKIAMSNPLLFVEKFTSSNRTYAEAFYNGKALNLLKYSNEGGWMFRKLSIGMSDDAAIEWLRENPEQSRELLREIDLADEVVIALERQGKPKGKNKQEAPKVEEETM